MSAPLLASHVTSVHVSAALHLIQFSDGGLGKQCKMAQVVGKSSGSWLPFSTALTAMAVWGEIQRMEDPLFVFLSHCVSEIIYEIERCKFIQRKKIVL